MILESVNWAKEHRVYRRDFNSHLVAVMIAGAYDRLARELVDSDGNRPNLRALVRRSAVVRAARNYRPVSR